MTETFIVKMNAHVLLCSLTDKYKILYYVTLYYIMSLCFIILCFILSYYKDMFCYIILYYYIIGVICYGEEFFNRFFNWGLF